MFYVVRNVFYFGLSLTNQTLGSRLVSEDDKLKERGVSLPSLPILFFGQSCGWMPGSVSV